MLQLRGLGHVSVRNLSVGSGSGAPDAASPPHPVAAFYSLSSPSGDVYYVSKVSSVYARAVFEATPLLPVPRDTFKVHFRLWTRPAGSDRFGVHYSLRLDLRNLRPLVSGSVPLPDSEFAANACVWGFGDRLYCLPSDVSADVLDPKGSLRGAKKKKSYTRDDIRHLARLTVAIREFARLKAELSHEIDAYYGSKKTGKTAETPHEQSGRLAVRLRSLARSLAQQEAAHDSLHSEMYAVRSSIHKITRVVSEKSPAFADLCNEKNDIVGSQIGPVFESLRSSICPQIVVCIRQLATVVSEAFPITVAASSPHFCISGIEFPSSIAEILDACYHENPPALSAYPGTTETRETAAVDNVNAGLVHIVSLMETLCDMLNLQLRFPVETQGSATYLSETLSPQQAQDLPATMTYPLFYDHTVQALDCVKDGRNGRFERGLQLLSKNLSFMMSDITDMYFPYFHDGKRHMLTNNIPMDCQDNYLWNLQYLMLFLTASD